MNSRQKNTAPKTATFSIKGMHCKSCTMLVTDIASEQGAKIESLAVDEKKQEGRLVATTSDPKKLADAIAREGNYKVTQIN